MMQTPNQQRKLKYKEQFAQLLLLPRMQFTLSPKYPSNRRGGQRFEIISENNLERLIRLIKRLYFYHRAEPSSIYDRTDQGEKNEKRQIRSRFGK